MPYSIWLEFEEYADSDIKDVNDGYCNISVIYDDGRSEGYNVWTVEFFRENIQALFDDVEKHGFATMPDIVVRRLEREHITAVLKEILGS